VLAWCFGGHEFIKDILPVLRECGLDDLDDDDDDTERGDNSSVVIRRVSNEAKSELARRTYARLAQAIGTLVQIYLLSRSITIVPSILRFGWCTHRNFKPARFPVMAAPVVDISGYQTGIHLTYLRADGSGKADFADRSDQRECRGMIRGGAIRLMPHDPTRALGIGEGIENSLTGAKIFNIPAWSAVSAGGIKTVELPPEVRDIVIFADNDASGIGWNNALVAEERWLNEDRSVRIVIPPIVGTDFNDVLKERGRNGRSGQ
jgi:putative DNA primase/helicase